MLCEIDAKSNSAITIHVDMTNALKDKLPV